MKSWGKIRQVGRFFNPCANPAGVFPKCLHIHGWKWYVGKLQVEHDTCQEGGNRKSVRIIFVRRQVETKFFFLTPSSEYQMSFNDVEVSGQKTLKRILDATFLLFSLGPSKLSPISFKMFKNSIPSFEHWSSTLYRENVFKASLSLW